MPATAPAPAVAVRPLPLATAVNVDCSPPFVSEARPASSAPSADDSAPNAEICVVPVVCDAASAAARPAVFAFTSVLTSVPTSIDGFPVEPLMIDCAACCNRLFVFAPLLTGVFVAMGGLRLNNDPVTSGCRVGLRRFEGRARPARRVPGFTGVSGKRKDVRYRIFKSVLLGNFL
ncbi:hypothetical protein BCEP27_31132 [Burkholderia cepacia]